MGGTSIGSATATEGYRPTIGVVITAFNAERYLDLALSSISHQTRLPDGIVVVDDGSTDATARVARAWSDRLPLILLSNSSNVGVGESRRKGVDRLSTDYVASLDADDFWLPEHIESTMARVAPHKVVAPLCQIWIDGRGLSGIAGSDRRRRRVARATTQLPFLLRENFVPAGSAFSRDLYRAVGGYPPTRFGEDYELWVRLALAGARFEFLDAPTVLYRRHPDAIAMTSSRSERSTLECIDRISSLVPRSMRRHSKHARRVSEARILLCQAQEDDGLSRVQRLTLLAPALLHAPFRQKCSAIARILR